MLNISKRCRFFHRHFQILIRRKSMSHFNFDSYSMRESIHDGEEDMCNVPALMYDVNDDYDDYDNDYDEYDEYDEYDDDDDEDEEEYCGDYDDYDEDVW